MAAAAAWPNVTLHPTSESAVAWTVAGVDAAGVVPAVVGMWVVYSETDVNHAVYALILQDLAFSLVATMAAGVPIYFFADDAPLALWLRKAIVYQNTVLTFHDVCWAIIGFIRYLKLVHGDYWDDLSPSAVRSWSLTVNWAAFGLHVGLTGSCWFLIQSAGATFILVSELVPTLAACATFAFYRVIVWKKSRCYSVAEEDAAVIPHAPAPSEVIPGVPAEAWLEEVAGGRLHQISVTHVPEENRREIESSLRAIR